MQAVIALLLAAAAQAPLSNLWDMDAIKNDPLFAETVSERTIEKNGIQIDLREIRYLSHIWNGQEIRIAGHLAVPPSEKPLPAMILVTGNADEAVRTAASVGAIILAIDRVGEGNSTGPSDLYANWLDLAEETDIRNSWMRHYAMSAARAVTYLHTLDEVDPNAVGVSGWSRGGLCSLLAAAVDRRIRLCVPIAATGDFGSTEKYEHNWVAAHLLNPLNLTTESLEWSRFKANYDPLHYLGRIRAAVWIVNGAQDEYFPITSTSEFAQRLNAESRLSLMYDADHGYFGTETGLYESYLNPGIGPRIASSLRKGIQSVLHGQGALPQTPELSVETHDRQIDFSAAVDQAATVQAARFVYSLDGAYTFERVELLNPSLPETGELRVSVSAARPEQLAAFIEVEYADEGGAFYLTSTPYLSEGFTPKIRPAPGF